MSFDNFSTDFNYSHDRNSFTIIMGENGSGKSCISSESIYFLIFGRGLRSNKNEDLINIYSDEAEISGDFIVIDENYRMEFRITRKISRNSTSSVKITIIHDDGKESNIFTAIRNLQHITKNNIINSKLQEIFNTSHKDFMKTHLHSPYSSNIVPHEQSIINDNILFNIFKDIEDINIIYIKCKKILDQLNLKISKYKEQLDYLNNLINNHDNNLDEDSLNKLIMEINENKNKTIKLLNKLREDFNIVNKNLITIDSNIISLKNKISELENRLRILSSEVCPTCGRKIPQQEIEKIIKPLNTEIEKNSKSLNKLLEDRKTNLNNLEIINRNINKINDKILLLDKEKNSILNKLENLKYIKNYDKIKKEINENIQNLSLEIQVIDELYNIFNKKSKYVSKNIFNNIKKLTELLVYIYKNISNSDDRINIEFVDNKISIFLNDIPYSLLSTSQKKKLELVYILTIIAYSISKIKRRNLNIVILDEFFDSFDPDTVFKIIYNLVNMKSKNTNTQIIITSNYFNSENIEGFLNMPGINLKTINLNKQ